MTSCHLIDSGHTCCCSASAAHFCLPPLGSCRRGSSTCRKKLAVVDYPSCLWGAHKNLHRLFLEAHAAAGCLLRRYLWVLTGPIVNTLCLSICTASWIHIIYYNGSCSFELIPCTQSISQERIFNWAKNALSILWMGIWICTQKYVNGHQPPLTKKVKLTHKKWFIGSRSEGGFFHEKANRKTLLEE